MRGMKYIGIAVIMCLLGSGAAWAAPQQIDQATQQILQDAAASYSAQDFAKTKKTLQPLVNKGNHMAIFATALMAAKGEGEKKDMKKAEKLWLKAANSGDPQSQYVLGNVYLQGDIDGNPDYAKARTWFSKASTNNDWIGETVRLKSDALYHLSRLQYEGLGGAKDEAGAVKKLEEAVTLGHPGAMMTLGFFYAEGQGVKQDAKKAKELFTQADQAGVPAAKEALAQLEKK